MTWLSLLFGELPPRSCTPIQLLLFVPKHSVSVKKVNLQSRFPKITKYNITFFYTFYRSSCCSYQKFSRSNGCNLAFFYWSPWACPIQLYGLAWQNHSGGSHAIAYNRIFKRRFLIAFRNFVFDHTMQAEPFRWVEMKKSPLCSKKKLKVAPFTVHLSL